jgi:hypothetical protein
MFRSRARNAFTVTTLVVMLATIAQTAAAQAKPAPTTTTTSTTTTAAATGGFKAGYTDIGPAIGLGNIGNAGAAIGGRFEHGIKPLPDMANGTLGIEASFDYYAYSSAFFGYSWSYTYMPIGVTANYHFKLEDPKFDPFLGAGLGYSVVTCRVTGPATVTDCPYASAVYFIGRVGGRYFFSPKMAMYADAGAGAATLSIGLMFKMK